MSKFVIYNSILYYFGWNTGTNNAVISKAALTGLSAIPNITLASLTMNKITNSDYSFVIFGISDSMVTSSITSFAFTASTKVFDRISYINQDIVPHTSAEGFLFLRENDSNVIQTISQTWSKSGNTNFEITIVQNGINIIPVWVSDDPSTMQLKLNTPSVNGDMNYSFKIQTKYGNLYSDEKIINLKVLNWLVLNWDLCQNDPALWQIWTSGYKVSTDSKSWKFVEQPSKTETNSQQNSTNTNDSIAVAGTVTQVVVGANVILGSTTSILCGTSTQGAWASINQFQLYLLVPLLNIYIHPDILDFLSGFTFSFFSFSFFRVEEFEFIKFILSVFSDKKSNNYLESIGIRYVNSFRNHAKIIFTLTIFIILHLMIFFPLHRLIKWIKSESFLSKIIEYILNLFMLTLYIRSLLEAFLFCFLSIIIEIQSIGFTYSIILFLFWIVFIGAFYTIWMRYWFGSLDKEISYFREFFSGIKESKIWCFYFNFFILRRVLWVLIVILLQDCSKYVQVVLFSLVNLICLGFSWGFRPFLFIKDNLIDIINDFSFAVFWTQMIYLNSESVWNKVSVNFSIYFCLSCCLLTWLINFICIWYELIKFIRTRIQKRKIINMQESDANNSALSHTTQNHHDEITLQKLMLIKRNKSIILLN